MTNSLESPTTQPSADSETFLERLKRQRLESETKVGVRACTETSTENFISKYESDKAFVSAVNIATANAKTAAYKREGLDSKGKTALVAEISSMVVIPDNMLTDVHNNEINFSSFVCRYLPKIEQARFISEESE